MECAEIGKSEATQLALFSLEQQGRFLHLAHHKQHILCNTMSSLLTLNLTCPFVA